MAAAVNRKDPFQFDCKTIAAPTQVNPIQNADHIRSTLNRDIQFHEIHDIFLDRTLSPARITDEPLITAFRQVAWSTIGLIPYRRCVLATVTADHRVTLYRKGLWAWEEVDDISTRWSQYIQDNNLLAQLNQDVIGHSPIYMLHKTKSYLLGTMAVTWSRVYSTGTSNWAWLVTLQRSGHVVVWKAQAPSAKVAFSTFHDLKLGEPSVLKIYPGTNDKQLYLFAGNYRGLLKCWLLSWNETEPLTFQLLGAVIDEEDQLSVNAIEISCSNHYLIVSAAKSNAIVSASIKFDGNPFERPTDLKYTLLSGLQLSGLTLADGKLICVTEDYLANEIELSVNNDGLLTEPIVTKLNIPSNATMLCRGVTAPSFGDGNTLFAIESVKVAYDHLKCRQPTSLIIYVSNNLQRITSKLETAKNMEKSLLILETYKVLNASNWESIWEMDVDNMNSEDDFYLQLLRWLALYKCNACFVERRYDKDLQDDLKCRAERAAFYLQIRHVERQLLTFLDRKADDDLAEDQLLILSLACHFMDSLADKDLSTSFDRSTVDRVRNKYSLQQRKIQEDCLICQEPIPFDDHVEGHCSNLHKANRCPASLQTCFSDTFSCQWCGTHFHRKSVIDLCILCGGVLA